MTPPMFDNYTTCPRCKTRLAVKIIDADLFMIADAGWQCSRCKGFFTSDDANEIEREQSEAKP